MAAKNKKHPYVGFECWVMNHDLDGNVIPEGIAIIVEVLAHESIHIVANVHFVADGSNTVYRRKVQYEHIIGAVEVV